jgi:hypothetical protein
VLGALYNTLPYFYQCKTEFLKNIALKKIVWTALHKTIIYLRKYYFLVIWRCWHKFCNFISVRQVMRTQ